MAKVAINGFGRIGRNVARAILERPDCGLELVSINDLADAKANARLFQRDSVHGPFSGTVEVDGNDLIMLEGGNDVAFGANGMRFATGIALAITGAMADADTTAVAANEIKVATTFT